MERKVSLSRKTAETNITIEINLDGSGKYEFDTGLKFIDHMLKLLSKHSGINLKVRLWEV